ncbi:LLM class flavin-dependent oxidoreductase [Nonomuraea sp. NPDC050680]|uniref:LLM class flavin-dependent oxidoreductase n=1 Tax=Nonomuraea sp. NPDC050680 TaxID=3154630 RepID=UPI0033D7EE74
MGSGTREDRNRRRRRTRPRDAGGADRAGQDRRRARLQHRLGKPGPRLGRAHRADRRGRASPGIPLGTAVVPVPQRHPLVLAGQALSVQAATGNRLTLGIGAGIAIGDLGPVRSSDL